MPLDPDRLQKPFRKLRKSLKKFPDRPAPEQVHGVRTNSRKLEAVVEALDLDQQRQGRHLLKTITPIRKDAGKVRDMDVLTGFSSTLAMKGDEQECLIQLLEYLGAKRTRSAGKLVRLIDKMRPQARRLLKHYLSLFEDRFDAANTGRPELHEWPATATAAALQISRELAAWPHLQRDNLHPYRLKVKQLWYILQLRDDPDDELVEALGDAKDAIGEWHDWIELEAIAVKILDHGVRCKLLQRIRSNAREKFDRAMQVTESLRRQHLNPAEHGRSGRNKGPVKLKEPVVITSAKLAA